MKTTSIQLFAAAITTNIDHAALEITKNNNKSKKKMSGHNDSEVFLSLSFE